jgi:hypothetical protein
MHVDFLHQGNKGNEETRNVTVDNQWLTKAKVGKSAAFGRFVRKLG